MLMSLALLPSCGAVVVAPVPVPDAAEETAEVGAPEWDWADSTVEEAHARALPPTIDATHYEIELRLDDQTRGFSGHVDTHAVVLADGACITMHAGEELEIPSARQIFDDAESTPVSVTRDGDVMELCLEESLLAGSEFVVRVEFAGVAGERDHYGLFTTQSAVSDLPSFYTQFESQGARLALPLHDEPYDKTTTTVHITGHIQYTLLSNGRRLGCESQTPGTQRCTFVNDDIISPYLITFVAAELETIEAEYERDDGSRVPLTVYTEPGFVADGLYAMYALERNLDIFEHTFGLPYPWEDYGIVALPGFRYGGMENKGLTNIRADALYVAPDGPMDRRYGSFSIIAHELAHEWFGNLVTMQWWDDVWLNEGFASYMTGLASAEEFDWTGNRLGDYVGLQRWYMDVERGPFAHPIVYDDWTTPEQLFDAISYTKGRKVLDMLEHLVGRDELFDGIRRYLEENAGSNAATARFFGTIERVVEQDLTGFVEPWLMQAGFPEVTATPSWDDEDGVFRLGLAQQSSRGADDATVWTFPMEIAVEGEGYSEVDWYVVDGAAHELTWTLPTEPTSVSINRGGIALIDLTVDGWTWRDWARQAANDSSAYGRGVAIYEMLEAAGPEFEADPQAIEAVVAELAAPIRAAIDGEEEALRGFAIGRIGDGDAPVAFRELLARELSQSLDSFARIDPGDELSAVQSRKTAISVLSYVDEPETHAFLREMTDARVDYLTTAVGALLRTSAADRFEVHAAAMERAISLGNQRMLADLVSAVAGLEDPGKFPRLLEYLADERICTPLDHQMPRRMLYGTLGSPEIAYSVEGLAFMLEVFTHELDRPGTIIRVVRAMQDASERPEEEQRRLRAMLDELERRIIAAGDPAEASEVVRMLRDSLAE